MGTYAAAAEAVTVVAARKWAAEPEATREAWLSANAAVSAANARARHQRTRQANRLLDALFGADRPHRTNLDVWASALTDIAYGEDQ